VLFCISVAGIFLNRKNVIMLLMSIELLLLSVNINFVGFSRSLGDPAGQVFVFFILTVAAAEPRSASPSWSPCSATVAPSTWPTSIR
jgi:NADH-quinone oxidoreductase subunit K